MLPMMTAMVFSTMMMMVVMVLVLTTDGRRRFRGRDFLCFLNRRRNTDAGCLRTIDGESLDVKPSERVGQAYSEARCILSR